MLTRACHEDDGAALVETAIVLPVLLVLGLGAFEVSFAVYQYHLITTGVRDAARYAARGGAIDTAKIIAVTGSSDSSTNPRVRNWTTGQVSIACDLSTGTGVNGLRNGTPQVCTASTTFPYAGLGVADAFAIPIPGSFTVSHSERLIGQ